MWRADDEMVKWIIWIDLLIAKDSLYNAISEPMGVFLEACGAKWLITRDVL
jgi:hypothetical protein